MTAVLSRGSDSGQQAVFNVPYFNSRRNPIKLAAWLLVTTSVIACLLYRRNGAREKPFANLCVTLRGL